MTSPLRMLTLSCALLLALAACKKQEQPAPPPPEVGVIAAAPQNVPLQRDLVGRLAPVRSSDVRARVPGVLLKRLYQEGSDVKEGQVLFQIDPAPLQAALSASQAQLASAQASYTNARVAADRARQLIGAEVRLQSGPGQRRSRRTQRRRRRAIGQGGSDQLAHQPGLRQRARTDLRTRRQAAGDRGRAGRPGRCDPADHRRPAGSAVRQFLDQRQRTGAVAERAERLPVRRTASRRSACCWPTARAYAETGKLDFSGTVVDPNTGAISLRATLPNPDKRLLPGSFVTLRATLGEQKNAFLIPQAAIQRDAAGRLRHGRGQGRQRRTQERGHRRCHRRQLADHQRPGRGRQDHRFRPAEGEGRRARQGHAMEA